MTTAARTFTATAATAAAVVLTSCSGGPPELTGALEAVCDEGTVAEPESYPFSDTDPEDWADPVEELQCTRGELTLTGRVYEDDPQDRLDGTSDSVESGDGSDYWTAVAEGDGRWVVISFSAAPSGLPGDPQERPEFLDPLEDQGFEIDG